MAAYHEEIQKIVEIVMVRSAPHAVVENRVVQTIYPADFVTPTPGLRERLRAIVADFRSRGLTPGEVWVTGGPDPDAEKMLLGLGWTKVNTRVDEVLYGQK